VELQKNDPGFHEVSYERRRWPKKAASLIRKNYIKGILSILIELTERPVGS
jgi:hypothetical protein